jgi:hypothetical protein
MRRLIIAAGAIAGLAVWISTAAPQAQAAGPYKVLKTQKVAGSGNGGFDYVNADPDGRRLYVARRADTPAGGQAARIDVYDLDTLASVGSIPNVSAHGVALDPKSGHGFASSKPITMFDMKTLKVIKTIDVDGGPDGLLFDPFNARVHVLSHSAPNDTVINAADGTVVGTIDLGGAPEQAATDGKGTVYVDLEDKDSIAVVDAAAMKVKTTYNINAECGSPAGLGLDDKNHVLFAACHDGGADKALPASITVVDAATGKIIIALKNGAGTDGGGFNPGTMEAFSSNGQAGTLSIVKATAPGQYAVEQELTTVAGGNFKTMTIDTKTGHILLIGAEYQAAPATATPPASGRGGRRPMVPDSFTILVVGK